MQTRELPDPILVERLIDLTRQSNVVEAQLVEHLAIFIERELHLSLSLRSPFAYARTVLGFSRDVAHRRLRAARALVINPEALKHLESGALSISSLAALAPAIHLPYALEFALGRSKREVADYVAVRLASLSPRGDRSGAKEVNQTALADKLARLADLVRGRPLAEVETRLARDLDRTLDRMLERFSVEPDERTRDVPTEERPNRFDAAASEASKAVPTAKQRSKKPKKSSRKVTRKRLRKATKRAAAASAADAKGSGSPRRGTAATGGESEAPK